MVDDLHGVNRDSQSTTIVIHEHVYRVWVTLVLLVNRNCQANTYIHTVQPVHEHVEILRMQYIKSIYTLEYIYKARTHVN